MANFSFNTRRRFLVQSYSLLLAAGAASIGCTPGPKLPSGPDPGPDPVTKIGTKIKRFSVDRVTVFGGQQVTFTVELATSGTSSTPVKFESDQPGLIQMPSSVNVLGTSDPITRIVGTVNATKSVTVTAIVDNERISHVITVVDGSKSRTYQPYPQAQLSLNVRWFPGLICGGSFNLSSVTAGGAVIVSDNLVPIDISGDRTQLSVKENASSSQISQGREVDLDLAGRLFAVKASLTSYIDTSSSEATNKYSLTVDYRVSKGKAAVDMPRETFERLQLKYLADPDGFESVYGTHYVSAVDRECYVRATYSLAVTSAESARKADLSIGVSGEWVAGSFSSRLSISDRLKLLSASSSISIDVETNAQNSDQTNIISAPSEVDKVLGEINALQTLCNSATPVVSGYYLSKWSELFVQVGGSVDRNSSTRRKVTSDLIQRLKQRRLLENVVYDGVSHKYLRELVDYYKDALLKTNNEINRLRDLLTGLITATNEVTYEPMDLQIEYELVKPAVTYLIHPRGDGTQRLGTWPMLDNLFGPLWLWFSIEIVGTTYPFRLRVSDIADPSVYWYADRTLSERSNVLLGKVPSACAQTVWFRKKCDEVYPLQRDRSQPLSSVSWQLDLVDEDNRVIASYPLPEK